MTSDGSPTHSQGHNREQDVLLPRMGESAGSDDHAPLHGGTSDSGARTVAFDDVVIDVDQFLILREGVSVSVEPQVFDVLRYLVENRDRVVPKAELLDNIWGDRFVSESALTSRIKTARRAVGDDGRRQAVIRTVHGRGYQFVAHVIARAAERIADAAEATANLVRTADTAPAIQRPLTPTFGRDEVIADIVGRLEPGTLTTLVGPAGIGKTRLAREIAAATHGQFPAGQWLIRLADIRDSAAVDQAILDALGVRRAADADAHETVIAALTDRPGLLVLDNCEHVLDGAATIVADIRSASSPVCIVTTSRQRLSVVGERVIDIPALAPDAAADLLAWRVDSHGGSLDPDDDAVGAICSQLDFLPLAIELASTQVRVLGLESLAALLDERMRLLTGGDETEGAHHRTLESAIDSSYAALPDDLQQTLCRLSVFTGPFDLDAGIALAGSGSDNAELDIVQKFVDLAERSLVVVERTEGTRSYRLLESVRLFCSERLTARPVIELSHLRYYRKSAEERRERLWSGDYDVAFAEVDAEWSNYRAAIEFAVRSLHIDEACRLLNATVDYADVAQRLEHAEWCERVIEAAEAEPSDDYDPDLLRDTKAALSRFLVLQDLDRSAELIEGTDPSTNLNAAITAAWCAALRGLDDETERLLREVVNHTQGTNGLAELYSYSLVVFLQKASGQPLADARQRTREVAAKAGDFGAAFASLADGVHAFFAGEFEAAIDLTEAAVAAGSRYGIELAVLGGYRIRARAIASQPDRALAAGRLRAGLERYRRQGHWTAVIVDSPLVAQLLLASERPEPALRILLSFSTAGYPGSWSTGIAELLTYAIHTNHPETVKAVGTPPPMAPRALCDFVLDRLDELIDNTAAP